VGTFSQGDSVAALVTGGAALTSITTGWNHTCALTAAGAAFCWGYNGNGRLGNNSTTQSNLPVAVSGSLTFSAIDTGNDWTCGLTTASGVAATDRQIYCWGYNGSGQLGNNSLVQSLVPVRVTEPFVGAKWASVSAGGNHTCGRTTTNVIYCWGYDGTGALGNDATLANSSVPVIVAGGLTWNSVVAGESHTCGIVADQTLRCWGYNANGQLGDNSNTQRPEPVTLANVGGLSWTTVSAGPLHTCAVTTTAAAYCWGYNAYGQLGDDTNTQSLQRVEVSGGLSFVSISVGGYHTCGRTALATYCWGANWYGQSGMPGTATSRDVPTLIIQ
jgi:alpha-tubulin suppressor-like RCC1 family protein